MTDFRTTKNFYSSNTATDGYDVYLDRQDKIDIISSKDINDLANSVIETQKALIDGYVVTDLLPDAVDFEDGQTLIYDSASNRMIAGIPINDSFKIQSVEHSEADPFNPTATIKAGFILLSNGKELRIETDLIINLNTVLNLSNLFSSTGTTYYLYISLSTLSSSITLANGRVVYEITESNFYLSIENPEGLDLANYLPVGFIRTDSTGGYWGPNWVGAGAEFGTIAAKKHNVVRSIAASPVVYVNDTITNAINQSNINHNLNIPVKNQRWSAQITDNFGTIYQPNTAEWLVDVINENTIRADFSFMQGGDTAIIKLEDTGLTSLGALPVKTYDSGIVAASTLNSQLPISHGLAHIPTALSLLREVTPGVWESADFGSFLTVSGSQLDGDLSALSGSNIRVIASLGAEAVISTMYVTRIISSNYIASASNELLVDCSSGPIQITLPSTASAGQRIKVLDMSGDAGTNNITLQNNGLMIEASLSNYVLNTTRGGVELIYSDATNGWLVCTC